MSSYLKECVARARDYELYTLAEHIWAHLLDTGAVEGDEKRGFRFLAHGHVNNAAIIGDAIRGFAQEKTGERNVRGSD